MTDDNTGAPDTRHPEAPASSKTLQQYVYTGVTEEQRPVLVSDLWHAKAIRVDVVRNADGTYTVTATFRT
jgi:hypothetical protein